MFSLTTQQKIANLDESISLKERKLLNLTKEIQNLKLKKQKMLLKEQKSENPIEELRKSSTFG